jgi:ATP-binding cassette, subfamily B, bacterial
MSNSGTKPQRPGVSHVLRSEEMPAAMLSALAAAGVSRDHVLAAFPADISSQGEFAARWLVICHDRLAVLEGEREAEKFELSVNEPYQGLNAIEYRGMVGGGLVLVKRGEEQKELVRCSRAADRAVQAALAKLRVHLEIDKPSSPDEEKPLDPAQDEGKEKDEEEEKPPPEALAEIPSKKITVFLDQLDELGEQRYCATCDLPLKQDSSVCPVCISRGKTLWRIFSFAERYRSSLYLLSALLVITVLFRVVPPYVLGAIFDEALAAKAPITEEIRKDAVKTLEAETPLSEAGRQRLLKQLKPEKLKSRDDRLTFLFIGLSILILANIFAALLRILAGRLAVVSAGAISRDVRGKVFRHLQYLSLGYFDRHKTGALMSRVNGDTRMLQGFLVNGVQFTLVAILEVLIITSVLLWLNWRLALLVLVPTPVVLIFTKIIWKKIIRRFRRLWEAMSRLSAVLNDSLRGVRVVKAFGGEEREVERFEVRSQASYIAEMNAEKTWITLTPIIGLIMGTGMYFVLGFGGWALVTESTALGKLTPGLMVQYITYLPMLYMPLQVMTRLNEWLTRSMTAAERIFEILDTEPEVAEPLEPVQIPEIKGRIEMRDVVFGYEKHTPVIKGMSVDIPPGEMLGLVGHSGAGKSTTINLVTRLYDADEGQILIDGVDIRRIPIAQLRSQVGVVLQETFLFSGTVYENIAYAKPDAGPEEVLAASKMANSHDFIMSRADGYDSEVEEGGGNFSSGEKQRLAIARAILHNPRILILDEATSSVDTKTEKQIQEAITRLIEGRTTIAIAHRLSTLRDADRLAVIDKGEIKELGTHEELVAKKGIYHELVKTQTEMTSVIAIGS